MSVLAATSASATSAVAASAEGERTGAPYFMVKASGQTDVLPLEETRGDVAIAGVIARVRVTQVWKNHGSTPLEAVYVFPASTRAAVSAMRMKIGSRTIEAKIAERQAARKQYERARDEGKTASLLEEERPNVFQMNVANVMPGDRIETVLEYTELLVPEDGTYAFVYPTVVGPRYVGLNGERRDEVRRGEDDRPGAGWTANPYLHEGEAPPYRWGMSVRLSAGLAVRDVSSPTHAISPRFEGPRTVRVEVTDERGGDRDFVLRYRLDGERIETGLLLYPGTAGKESFFLLMAQPPARVEPRTLPPREYVFVLDVSGSMSGFPLETAKATMKTLLSNLRSEDRFNVMCFSGGSAVLAEESLPATPENVARALAVVSSQQGGGATEIVPALKRALALPRTKDVSTSFVVVTDGYVAVEQELFTLIHDHLGTANLFAFGIGSSVNRALIEGMARAGTGQPFVVLDPTQAAETATKLRRYIESPVLVHPRVRFEGFDAYDVEPPVLPDLFAARPIVLFGKYRGQPTGRIVLEGTTGAGPLTESVAVDDFTPSDDHAALRALWARDRIARLSDFAVLGDNTKNAPEVKRLGLTYELLTSETSFVAVDTYVRNTDKKVVSVKQPLPLPRGVSDAAVGQALGVGGLGTMGMGSGGGGMGLGVKRSVSISNALVGLGSSAGDVGGLGTRGHGAEGRMGGAGGGGVALGAATVEGSIATDVIKRVIQVQLPAVRRCYERALEVNPALVGRLVLRLKVSAEGRVTSVEAVADTLRDPAVTACVASRMRALRFPAPAGGGAFEITYPFVFASSK